MLDEVQARGVKSGALAVIALAAVMYAYTYNREIAHEYPQRTFTVDGSAEVDMTPDVAMFSVTVLSEGGQNVAELQKTNSEKMNRVNTFVKDQGVKAKDLKTLQYNLSPRYNYPVCTAGNCPPASIVGYTLTQSLQVKVRDTDTLSDLLSGVVAAGANSVSDVQFVLDDDTDAKSEAREEAIAKAKVKARDTAQVAGFRLGELVTLYESMDPGQPYYGGMGGAMDVSAKAPAAPAIEPGTQTTKVTVSLTYEIRR